MVPAKIEIQRAHLRNSDGVRNRLWYILEDATHLLRALEKQLIAFGSQPLRIVERRVRLNAYEEILGGRIFLSAVVHVVRRHQRQIKRPREPDEITVDSNLIGEPMVLQLYVETTRTEDFGELARVVASGVRPVVEVVIRDWATEAGGCGNNPIAMFGQHLQVHSGPIVVALELSECGELQEVSVTSLVLGEKQEMVRLSLAGAGATFGQVGLDADDRVQPGGSCRAVPLHGPIHDPMVGNRNVLNSQFAGAGRVLLRPSHPVEERILCMEM